MRNNDIRQAAAARGVHLWQIADEFGMTDSTFSRLLRREFPAEKKQEILAIIDRIASQNT